MVLNKYTTKQWPKLQSIVKCKAQFDFFYKFPGIEEWVARIARLAFEMHAQLFWPEQISSQGNMMSHWGNIAMHLGNIGLTWCHIAMLASELIIHSDYASQPLWLFSSCGKERYKQVSLTLNLVGSEYHWTGSESNRHASVGCGYRWVETWEYHWTGRCGYRWAESQRVKGTYMRAALWHYATGVRGSVILSHYSQWSFLCLSYRIDDR